MSQKIHQLDMFKTEKDNFEELTARSLKALFSYVTARDKAMKTLIEAIPAMQEMVMHMNDRLNRLAEK
jgi:tryptophan synthase alpha subunit